MNRFKISLKIQILLAMTTAISCSFLQMPSNQFHSTFNSSFLAENKKLFKPIIIPNATKYVQNHNRSKTEVDDTNDENDKLQSEETLKEDSLDKKSKIALNPVKFSSRYSTEQEIHKKEDEKFKGTNDIPDESDGPPSKKGQLKHSSFSVPSDDVDEGDEDTDDNHKNSDEMREGEVALTTDVPYSQPPIPTSFQKYENEDEDFENDETTSTIEDTDSSEEKEEEETEEKRSVEDYHNSGSKNYHSIQTPLNQIHYRPQHEKTRTRLVSPIERRPANHNWPYSKPSVSELEDLNEISDSDESHAKDLDVEIKKEVKTKPKQLGLELAVQKDESKFDRNKKFSYIQDSNRQKQRQKSLIAEEEKDDKKSQLRNPKQYQVNEKPSNDRYSEGVWASTTPKNVFEVHPSDLTAHKNIFKIPASSSKKPKTFSLAKDLSHDFPNHEFLGPVVFKENSEENNKPVKNQNLIIQNINKNEKLDQDHLNNRKIQKSMFSLGNKYIKTFNHLEENNEMYNAILANIQSVFGLRINPLKSSSDQKADVNLDESKSFTWSLPLKKLN